MKRNIPILGFIIGVLMPLVGFGVVFLIFRQGNSLAGFFENVWINHQMLAKVLSLSILANLIPFIYCTNKRYDYTARGIFSATILYGVFILLLKFVWS